LLRFCPTAWAKLLYFRDKTHNEVGGFGITQPDDLLYVRDFVTVRQKVTCVSVSFEDEAVADFFENQVVLGRKPEQFARIWLHTHPADIAGPSMTDEDTFQRVFGNCHWAIMFILARDNQSYARIGFNVGPGGQILIPVQMDYSKPFDSTDIAAWDEEFHKNVMTDSMVKFTGKTTQNDVPSAVPATILSEFEKMPADQQMDVLDELAVRTSFLDEEQEGLFL
jgi:hypothetical protein